MFFDKFSFAHSFCTNIGKCAGEKFIGKHDPISNPRAGTPSLHNQTNKYTLHLLQ